MSNKWIPKKFVLAMVAAGLTAGACGADTATTTEASGGGVVEMMMESEATPQEQETATDSAGAEPATETGASDAATESEGQVEDMTTGQVIDSWGKVPDGVVQIEAQGDRIDIGEFGLELHPDRIGYGTGFFVDASGVIVTNNHVVTGAASVQVHLPGDDLPRNARVLGASECWDLAVIELVDGGDYPHFAWTAEAPAVATEVYAVGYPVTGSEVTGALDSEITVTKGVVSKASARPRTAFASVDHALETDADINGGNSGGPLVTEDGTVVGINFAGNDARQGYAIKADAAMRVITSLKEGQDLDYIGLTAEAFTSPGLPGGGAGGLFVHAIETGSPAYNARDLDNAAAPGVQAGEVILRVEDTNVAEDGTMEEYCDILRTRGERDITLTVWNPTTDAIRFLLVSQDA